MVALAERALALREDEWQLRDECVALAREALLHYKARGPKKLNIANIGHLLDLADKLGRRAIELPTDDVDQQWHRDPEAIAAIDREIERLWQQAKAEKAKAEAIDVPSKKLPNLVAAAVTSAARNLIFLRCLPKPCRE